MTNENNTTILWLGPKPSVNTGKSGEKTKSQKDILNAYRVAFARHGLDLQAITIADAPRWVKRSTTKKEDREFNNKLVQAYYETIDNMIKHYDAKLVVVNTKADLEYLIGQKSTYNYTGHVFHRNGIPYVVCDDTVNAQFVESIQYAVTCTLMKIIRIALGKPNLTPKFRYFVPTTPEEFEVYVDAVEQATAISIDIETTGGKPGLITCVGFTSLMPDGQMLSCVLPTFNHHTETGNHFHDQADSVRAWKALCRLCANPVPKVFCNGQYDMQHLLVAGVVVNNYLLDSAYLQHSYQVETLKSLVYTSACYLDDHYYWKDQIKGDMEVPKEAVVRVPSSKYGQEMYWRYCALDCHNTLMSTIRLLKIMRYNEYSIDNYSKIFFPLIVGPAIHMNLTGFRINMSTRNKLRYEWEQKLTQAETGFHELVGQPKVNLNSPTQLTKLIYDGLKADETKLFYRHLKAKTDSKVLALTGRQNYVLKAVIDKLIAYRKAKKRLEVFEDGKYFMNRYFYTNSPTGTETARFSSGESAFWCGGNIQNITKGIRHMMIADQGYFLYDADFSNSDTWFVAHDAEDTELIDILNRGDDNHLRNASIFFQKPYETLLEMKKNKDVTLRTLSKTLGHGVTYNMGVDTMFLDMGVDNVITSLKSIGAYSYDMTYREMSGNLTILRDRYFAGKPKILEWQTSSVQTVIENGNQHKFWGGFTRQFLLDVETRKAKHRQIVACVGQSGTGMNTARTLLRIYYGTDLMQRGLLLTTQTHDNVVAQIPVDKPEMVQELNACMQHPCVVKGRTFTVPIEVELGYSWGRGLIPYKEGDVIDFEAMKTQVSEALNG